MGSLNRLQIAGFLLLATMLSALPAFSQIDFSGEWTPNGNEDSIGNPYVGDWLGIPMNDAARARAEAWAASVQTLPEWQCRPHGFAYIYRRPIYLDGRPHPSENAPHTWGGFNTAEWVGDMLKITTTHVKEEYLRRNGVQHSDLITITTYWIRRGDILTWLNIVYDPVYLTEPLVRTQEYRLALNQQIPPYPCDVVEEVDRPKGVVPHQLPGTNTFVKEFADKIHVPEAVIRAGAETMYPEIRKKLK